jgi:hypothetical protein
MSLTETLELTDRAAPDGAPDAPVLTPRLLPRPATGGRRVCAACSANAPGVPGGPAVDRVPKGNARTREAFDCRISSAATLDGGLFVGMRSMPGNRDGGDARLGVMERVDIFGDAFLGGFGHDIRNILAHLRALSRGIQERKST